MPGRVEGVFILGDRASAPAKKIRFELRELQMQAERTGKSLDDVGGIRHARTLDQTARDMRTLGQETRGTGGHMRELGGHMGRTRREARGLGSELRVVGNTLRAIGSIIRVMRWPAIIAGVGGLTQVVTGLAAGLGALVPGLIQAGGAAIGLVPVYGGLAGALGTTMLAFSGLSEAMGGNREALKRLTPEARAFVEVLKDGQREIRGLRRAAQQELFPSLERSMRMLLAQRRAMREIVRQQAGDTGRLAEWATTRLTRPDFMRELVALSDQSARAFGGVARGAFRFAEGIVHLTRAAAPFTDWLSSTVEHMGALFEKQMRVGQQTGELAAMFDRSRRRLEQFGRITADVFGALRGTMRAATDVGDDLWKSIERGADRWERWANSFKGQYEMRRFFNDMRPVIRETAGLVGDLAEAFLTIARGPEGALMIRELRQAVPGIAQGVREITANFGPQMVAAFGSFVGLIAELGGHTGPLTLVVGAIGQLAEVATAAVDALGPLGNVLLTGFGAAMLMRRVSALRSLAGAIRGVGLAGGGAAAPAAGVATAAAGGGIATPAATGARAQAAGTTAVVAPAVGAAGTRATRSELRTGRTAGGAIIMGPTGRGAAGARPGAALAARARGVGRTLTAPGGAGRFAGGTARTLGPSMLLMGLLQGAATQGGLGARTQGAASGITLGIIPRPIAQDERSQNAAALAQTDVGRLGTGRGTAAGGFRAQREPIERLEQMIGTARGNDRLGEKNADVTTYTDLLREELKVRRDLLRDTISGQQREIKEASVRHAQTLMTDFGRAFDVRSKRVGPVAAMEATRIGVLEKMQSMKWSGSKVLGENVLAWARSQAKGNPKMLAEVEKLENGIKRRFSRVGKHIEIVNGRILTGSTTEWRGIKAAITTQTEIARQEASEDFTAIQDQAVGSLQSMGFSKTEARDLVRKVERGNRKGASASDKLTGKRAASAATRGGARAPTYQPGPAPDRTGDGVGVGDYMGEGFGSDVARERAATASASASAGLMGANPNLSGYAQEASRFGLHVTSGSRPGDITSYGNVSFHSSGHAIDIGNGQGPDEAKMRFARYMISRYGSQLEELIYTPLGFSIKNGQRTTPIAAADHYDHVHVADTDPAAGAGVGLSMDMNGPGGMVSVQIPPLQPPGSSQGGLLGAMVDASSSMYAAALTETINDALMSEVAGGGAPGGDPSGVPNAGTLSLEQLAALAAEIGFPDPRLAAAIFMAESGGRVGIVNSIGATGLAQILTSAHPQYDPQRLASDARYNLQAAYNISSGGTNWQPWEAYTKGMHQQFLRGDGAGAAQASVMQALAAAIQSRPRAQAPGLGVQVNSPLVSVQGPLVSVQGGDAKQTAQVVRRELNRFAGMIVEEIGSMSASAAGAMG